MKLRDHRGMFISSLKVAEIPKAPEYDREAARERVERLTMRTRRIAWHFTDGEWRV